MLKCILQQIQNIAGGQIIVHVVDSPGTFLVQLKLMTKFNGNVTTDLGSQKFA